MHTIFADPIDSKEFAEHGYFCKQVLNAEQIGNIIKIHKTYFPDGTQNFYSSTFITNIEIKREINERLSEVLLPQLESHFKNYKVLGAQFLIKNPGTSGIMPFHQDWMVVDEEKYRSLTVWIALSDVSESNGAIKVVAKSHEFSRAPRGPGNFDKLMEIQDLLEEKSETLELTSGEAIIFDHSLIHGSGTNTSDKPRIAVALGLVHKDAPLVFYHRSGNDKFEKFKVADDFFITFPNDGQAPPGASLMEVVPFDFEKTKPGYFTRHMQELNKIEDPQEGILPLFLDADLQARFEKDGFVKIGLLNADEVKDLKDFYLSLKSDPPAEYGFHISLENKSEDYISKVFKKLFATIMPRLDPLLVNYKTFTASYVIKETGLQNVVPPHQDWSFVDEQKYCSATVWIPLVNVNKKNGALGVIRGSHRIFNYPRASPSPQARTALSNHAFNLFPFVEVIDMHAGEALIFNNRTVHASPPNISGETRIAAGIGITQKDAQLLHYFQLSGKKEKIDVYEVDESFFPAYNNSVLSSLFNKGESPQGFNKLRTFAKETPELSGEEITKMVSSLEGVKIDRELMAELANLYNYNPDGTPITDNSQTNKNKGTMNNSEATPKSKVAESEKNEAAAQAPQPVVDNRTFFQKYTPANIIAEIKYRLRKK